ncbi:3-oxoacyl-(acyl-carrier-protein) reductase [Alkaliphilus metalliredigens QYMF]|uniref:3-oxoacyl-[acyl-carrier-protein] reductase n=1 Tax=Alkaliphilus metalliredigens (strain QYMF) TaxID=293826 RepID=A6TWY4_ALKMQ|nr:3-oxoacyl-[acyl-carrier-protein] reductase [Alkaliphilus metalliredigens]ABR50702.1 3-oxoacyl-(acyl-carrier-protein) reductase [Alkaliphilus metalliredigens QYMF]
MRLEGKVAVVTGSTSGIGKAAITRFAEEGAKIVVWGQREEDVQKVVAEFKGKAAEVFGVAANVANSQEANEAMDKIKDHFGKIDILVNNAGITADAQLTKMTEDQFDNVIAVNLKGVYNCGQSAAKIMAEQKSGVIINVSSVVGVYGNFGQTNYAATKFGVIGMTKTWAKELGRKGVRVNAVAPGFILTEMVQKMPDKVLDMMKGKSPLGLLGDPEDIANAFLYLASDEAKFVTGTVLSVDGGVVL